MKYVWIGLVVVAAVAGYLYFGAREEPAPVSVADEEITAPDVVEGAGEAGDDAAADMQDEAEAAGQAMQDAADAAADTAGDAMDAAGDAADAAGDAASDAVDSATETATDAADATADAIDEAQDTATGSTLEQLNAMEDPTVEELSALIEDADIDPMERAAIEASLEQARDDPDMISQVVEQIRTALSN
ncbi:hypothetical protein DDZ14_01455 [Maritimibacter sp. 55A14]|uniref:hypothetical protein n=1 Tax=Maritimibacter sp. 55A14 TaxID=2174844 RepID=UPI000D60839E|nr:hypothetical protein [Maritimibacter sp. 55A14]PWE34397.1 hypothetical protein DDZ14_01455 [Maritimibacter sp. 55A14]